MLHKTPIIDQIRKEQGRIHGYLSRVRLGRGSIESLLASKQQNHDRELDDTDRRTDGPTDIAS